MTASSSAMRRLSAPAGMRRFVKATCSFPATRQMAVWCGLANAEGVCMGDFRPFRQLSARFRYWYEGSLVNRTALKAQMLVTTILVLISAVAYLLVSEQLRNSVNERLTSVASLDAQRLNSEIDRVLGEFENLSRRSLVANGLADSSESNAYLRPFLSEYRLTFPEMRALSLVDSYGQVVASSD